VGRGLGGVGRGANAQNEPNLPGRSGPRKAKCAKRSQFPPALGGTRLQGRGTRGIARNEPNLPPPRWDERDRSRQTKPIAPVEGVGRGRPTYEEWRAYRAKQSQFGAARLGLRGANCAKRTQFQDRAGRKPGQLRKTNPISQGLAVQNEPNFRQSGYPFIPLFHYATIPVRCPSRKTKPNLGRLGYLGDAKPTKRQFCKTKPIWKEEGSRERAAGIRRGTDRAKQTQSVEAGRAKRSQFPAAEMPHYSTILSFHHSSPPRSGAGRGLPGGAAA